MSTIATTPYSDDVLPLHGARKIVHRFSTGRPWRLALSAFYGNARLELGSVTSFEPACVVPDDPGEVVRGAKPTSSSDRDRMREQHIARMMADYRRHQFRGSQDRISPTAIN